MVGMGLFQFVGGELLFAHNEYQGGLPGQIIGSNAPLL
jgi:hypothetical protein